MTYPVWQCGTPEGLLCHVQSALGAIHKDRDVNDRYNAAVAERKEAQGKVQELKKLLEACDVEEDDVTRDDLAAQIAALKKVVSCKKEEARKVAGEAFNIYATLLGNARRVQWESWVKEMTDSKSWVTLQGKTKKGKCRLTLSAFNDCIVHHLKMVFPVAFTICACRLATCAISVVPTVCQMALTVTPAAASLLWQRFAV